MDWNLTEYDLWHKGIKLQMSSNKKISEHSSNIWKLDNILAK